MLLRSYHLLSFLILFSGSLSLRAQPPHDIKCGTPLNHLHAKGLYPQFALPPNPHDSLFSSSHRFLIHFDATISDTDSVTTLAYAQRAAEEADSAYDFEINVLGYTAPEFTMNGHYDIYLAPVHLDPLHAYYGATYWLTGGELPSTPSGVSRSRSYCIIDNSFKSSLYATHGYDALRVTVFHEFFHVVQFSGYGMPPTDGVFFQEMSSVWMEWLSSPQVKDYLNYLSSYVKTLDLRFDLSPGSGYGQYVLFSYFTNRFDTGIVKQIWVNYRDSTTDPVTAIDMALTARGSSFCQEYMRFGAELARTGFRNSGASLLPDANSLLFDSVHIHVMPLNTKWTFQAFALSLQFAATGNGANERLIVIATKDTARNSFQSNGSIEFLPNGGEELILDDPGAFCDTEFFMMPIMADILASPNPFVISSTSSNRAYMEASRNTNQPVSTVLDVFSISGTKIRHGDVIAEPLRETWNATWDGRDDIGGLVESGEYVYTLKVDGVLKVGKIVVVRK